MIDYLLTFGLAVASVGLWTLRVALTARGRRVAGSFVATIEAVVFVVAFSHVLGSLETPGRIVVYGLGVGTGTFTGLSVDAFVQGSDQRGQAKSTQERKRSEMKFRQRRGRSHRVHIAAMDPRGDLDLNIEEIVAQLEHPFAKETRPNT